MQPESSFIVRFLGPDSEGSAGAGALVGPKHVVTCAHVVNTALDLDQRAQGKPDDPVRIVFPLLGGGAPGTILTARVAVWRPPPEDGALSDDVAGLVIKGDLPDGASPAQLAASSPRPDSAVRVCGFTSDRPNGRWVPAVVRGTVANRRLQLDSKPGSARVQRGFSGTPVIDNPIGRVVGIIAESGKSANDSYAIPVEVLQEVWPEVLEPPTGVTGAVTRRPEAAPLPARRRKRLILLAGAIAAAAALLSYLIVATIQPPAGISASANGSNYWISNDINNYSYTGEGIQFHRPDLAYSVIGPIGGKIAFTLVGCRMLNSTGPWCWNEDSRGLCMNEKDSWNGNAQEDAVLADKCDANDSHEEWHAIGVGNDKNILENQHTGGYINIETQDTSPCFCEGIIHTTTYKWTWNTPGA